MNISLIMPTRNDNLSLVTKTLDTVINQTLPPREIIIIDSSNNEFIEELISSLHTKKIKVIYKRILPSYAGKSLNLGISLATHENIALLDTKTYVSNDWLKAYSKVLNENLNINVVFGSTEFNASANFQKMQKDLLYGNISHETVPGTLARKQVFEKYKFNENVRSSYDLLWRESIKKDFTYHKPAAAFIFYDDFSNGLIEAVKRFFIYSYHTALTNTDHNKKDIYFSTILIISFLLIPWWNYFLGNWNDSQYYVDDIGKKYFFLIFILFTFFQYFSRFFVLLSEFTKTNFILKSLTILLGLYIVLRWNDIMADWVESSLLYVPHITKIYFFLVLFIYLVYRGVLIPIKRGVKASKLLPIYWIKLSILGLIFDLAKMPGYFLGSILLLLNRFFK